MVTSGTDTRLAVLIDADNAGAQHLERLLVEIAKYGTATVRRAYGDWTTPNLGKWKAELLNHSVQPVQQFRYTVGKNATDSALIIDAMDLLHAGTVDGFCLVSSDSDFTRLAARIREEGLKAYGFGETKTPKPFIAACDVFVYVENLIEAPAQPAPAVKATVRKDPKLDKLLVEAVASAAGDDGWAHLGAVGQKLSRLASDFDSRSWGFTKLADLFRAHADYEFESRETGGGKAPNAFVRRKR
jgi:uncharacterized LabA/DUF88 family protein